MYKIIKILKSLTKFLIRKLGYQIRNIKKPDPISLKYRELINEMEGIYHELLFKNLPSNNENRTELLSKLLGTPISEGFYLLNYLHESLGIDGDICEFGVAQGATSAFLANEIKKTNKSIWLFDSFCGLNKPTEKDILKDDIFSLGSIEAYEGTMSSGVNMVKKKLNEIGFPLSRVKIVSGFIEETINFYNLPDKVCFAYVDFDFYEPILIALKFLDKSLQINGYIIVDDYDFFSTGAKTAVDDFIEENKGKYEFSLPIKSAGYFCILKKII